MRRGWIFLALFFALAALGAGPAFANSYLISPNPNSGQKFPMQGDCSQHGINPADPQIDVTRSTWACQGASNQMLRVFYQNGPEVCVYIDNFTSNDGEKPALFVPLNSSDEWLAFEAHKPGGVHLRYGCPGQIVSDDCGNRFSLPDAPASDNPGDVIHVATSGDYTADYACPYTGANGGGDAHLAGGCGTWQKVNENGACVVTAALSFDVGGGGGCACITSLQIFAEGTAGSGNALYTLQAGDRLSIPAGTYDVAVNLCSGRRLLRNEKLTGTSSFSYADSCNPHLEAPGPMVSLP